MTSGSITRGVAMWTPGIRYQKTWSGSDWPKLPKAVKPPLMSPVYLDRKGRKRLSKAILKNNRLAIDAYKAQSAAVRQRVVKRQRERRFEVHPYSCDVFVWLDTEISYQGKPYDHNPPFITNGCWGNVFGGAVPLFAPAWTASDDYKLVEKLKTKIIGSDFNLGVFAAEFSEAAHMIFNAANRLQLALKAASKGRWREALRHLRPPNSASKDVNHFYTKGRTTSQNWLELQYGWLPLISDLQSGAEMLAHMTSMPYQQKVVARLRKGRDGPMTSQSPSNTRANGTSIRRKQIVAYLREVDVPQLIGLTDYASIVWERLPYSFVADWAIPIGNFLAARGVASALKGTFVTTESSYGFVTSLEYIGTGGRMLETGPYNQKEIHVRRTVSSSLQVPMPTVKPLKDVLSWRRAANAVALLVLRGTSTRR